MCYNLINKIIKVESNVTSNNYHFKQFIMQRHNGNVLYTRVGTLIVATIYLQLIQNRYMFRSFTVFLQAVDRSIRTINTTDAAKGILRLPHRWQRVVHNAGDYIEGQ